MTKAHIVLIPGDGVGQEVIPAAATVLRRLLPEATLTEAPAGFAYFQQVGEALPEATLTLARQADAVLFGATASPLQPTPGYRSPILALRQALGLYANLRPVRSLPGVGRAGVDMLIVRENSEGLYYSPGFRAVDWALNKRIITRRASERIAHTAFRWALRRAAQRRRPPRVTVIHKANVLRHTDGLFREAVLDVAAMYPQVAVEEMLVDAAAFHLVRTPERFDVLVTPNLYGDILSDLAAGLTGGLGVAPSANLGTGTPLFEPVHGAAPDIAGRGIANPTAVLLSAALLLETLGAASEAERLRRAVDAVLQDRVRTPDLGGTATTTAMLQAVLARLERGAPTAQAASSASTR